MGRPNKITASPGINLENLLLSPLKDAASGSFWRRLGLLAGIFLLLTTLSASAQSSSVTFAWNASTNQSVAGYHIYYGVISRVYLNMLDAGTSLSKTITGLVPGLTYYFSLTCYDTNGVESLFSDEISYQVPLLLLPPVISLNSPVNGSSYYSPAAINIAATVVANGHTINKVQFYNGSTLLGTDTASPYNFTWNNSTSGAFYVTAQVTYDTSSTLSSLPALIAVITPPPAITTQPGSVAAGLGGNASFSVVASGTAPLTYQWRLNGKNLAAGGHYSGVTSSILGISGLLASDAGTYSVVISNGGGSVTSANASLTVTAASKVSSLGTPGYVTSVDVGSLRNDFSGLVGMNFVVGPNPLMITALGRLIGAGNSGSHIVKLVNASDGTDVPGGSATVVTANGDIGEFQYANLTSPVTLAAGTSYYIVSQEKLGGDLWYDVDTVLTTTSAANCLGGIWGYGPGQWYTAGILNNTYVPVDFKYATAPSAYVTGTSTGTLRNDFAGFVGMNISVGANPLVITALGRMRATGNANTHTLKLVYAGDGTDVPGASASISMKSGTAGQFQYATLDSPVILKPGTSVYVLSQESLLGDLWYDIDTTVTTTAAAFHKAGVWGYGFGQFFSVGATNQTFVPVDFKYASTPTTYVTDATPGSLRNDFTGFVGMDIVVGASPLVVTALGRLRVDGNSGSHTLKLVNGSDGSDVPGGSVSLKMNDDTPGQFQYATLANPVTLVAGGTYYILSQESLSGDLWYDIDTTITTTTAANHGAGIWGYGSGQWYSLGTGNETFVPVDFVYIAP